jgi:hypothetical protein
MIVDILMFAVPAATGLLGLVKLLDRRSPVMRILTTTLIVIGGAGSALLVRESGRVEARRAVAAEQAQQRAEAKLDGMTGALLDIQQDLAKLQVQLAKAPQGSTGAAGAALKATLQKVDEARQIVRPSAPSVKPKGMPGAPTPPATKPATKSAVDDK